MAGIDQNTLWQLASMILGKPKEVTTTRERATFLRTDSDGTQWVRLPSSNDETPVNGRTLATAKAGDTVEWSIDNGRLSITGNSTSPSVGSDYVGQEVSVVTKRVDAVKADIIETNELLATKATITELEAESARIDSIEADVADIDTIRANSAKVQNLTAAQLEADHAKVSQLDVSQIEADHATIGNLDTTYMHANMSNSDVAWIENGTIKDGAIVSAMINDVSANKLTAGTINGSVINVTNLNADNITAGTINGQRIGTGSLSLDKLSEDVYTESEVNDIVDDLNDRIDGAIETHTGTAVPTLNNQPASSWNTTALKDEHVGDVYYVVNSQSQQNGYCYRFTKSGSTYSWQLIKDSDVTAALSRLTTAEGKITSIESFDSTVSSFMTNTDSELTSVKSRATSLETRMTDAEEDISEKVDTSTFNTLSQTVDGNSASITSMGTVLTNNGLTSSTNITNTVNTVSQTASGNSSKITQLTTTLGTNADGTTKAGDVMHRTSAIEQDVSSFKTTVSETYATKSSVNGKADASDVTALAGRVTTAESNITQNANNIALKVSESDVTGNYVVGKINLNSTTASIAAQRINLQGAVTISDLSSDAQSATLNSNISVGGRNLLTGTDLWLTTFNSHSSCGKSSETIPAGSVVTVSVEVNADNLVWDTTSSTHRIGFETYLTKTGGGYQYFGVWAGNAISESSNVVEAFTGSIHKRISKTFTLLGDFEVGRSGYIYTQGVAQGTVKVGRAKIEYGNTATDWTPAPEDAETYADESAYLRAKPNLAPLGSAEFSDVYNATTNPDGYWRGTVPNWFTQLDDGWVHVHKDNSSGTSATNTTMFRPSASPSVFAGKVYTILTEIRNNASTGTGTNDLYLYSMSNNQFYGNTSGVVIDDDHVTTTTTVSLLTCGQSYVLRSYRIADTDHLTAGTPSPAMFYYNFRVAKGSVLNFDFRMSVYEGIYDGPYKPYAGTQLFATQTDASNAAKTATSYVTDITGGGIMVHPSGDQTTGVKVTDDVDILRDGTSVINVGESDAIRIGSAGNVQMLLESDGLGISNEAGSEIFAIDSGSTGSVTIALDATLVTWNATADVGTTAYTVSDAGAAAGDAVVTATVNGTEYQLDSTYATATVTAGTGVSVALTSAGVTYVRGLMVETVEDDGNTVTTTYPCELTVEYQHAVTDIALLSLIGQQTIDGEGESLLITNSKWVANSRQSSTLVQLHNATTGRGLKLGVASNGYVRGLWDSYNHDWVIARNKDNKTVINGPNFSVSSGGTVNASGTIASSYQVSVKGIGSTSATRRVIALRSNSAGNRGLYDVSLGKWILYKRSDGTLVLNDPLYVHEDTCTVNTSNATISGSVNHCWHNGAVCTITITVNLKSSLASNKTVTVATAPSGYRPAYDVVGQTYITGQNPAQLQAQISTAGAIVLNNRSGSAVGTSANIYISFTFAL